MLDSFKPLIKKKKEKERIDRNMGRQNPRVGGGGGLDQKFPFYLQDMEAAECVNARVLQPWSQLCKIYIHMIKYMPSYFSYFSPHS